MTQIVENTYLKDLQTNNTNDINIEIKETNQEQKEENTTQKEINKQMLNLQKNIIL